MRNPPCVPLFVQVGIGKLLQVQQDVVHWLIRVVYHASLVIKVETADRTPIDSLLLVPHKVEVGVAEDVVLVIYDFDLSLLNLC